MEKELITMSKLEVSGRYSVVNPFTSEIFVSDLDNSLDCMSYWRDGVEIEGKVEGDLFVFEPIYEVTLDAKEGTV